MNPRERVLNVLLFLAALLAGNLARAAAGPKPTGTAPQPLIREVKTGYLLNSFFLSPRPYCWDRKDTVKLSGWEIDKAGGDIDYRPSGEYGKDFNFHSDWFKLVDTSPSAAVTLKHQIARQTDGRSRWSSASSCRRGWTARVGSCAIWSRPVSAWSPGAAISAGKPARSWPPYRSEPRIRRQGRRRHLRQKRPMSSWMAN